MDEQVDAGWLRENRLLTALSAVQFYRLLPHLELTSLTFRQTLCGDAEMPEYAYFPLDAVVSLVSNMSGGKSVELAMIGKDGAIGIFGLFDPNSKYYEYRVQIPGSALRVKTAHLKEELERDGMLPRALMRYIPALCAQISQVAACNRLHKVEQRLSTWLLMMHNRVEGDEINLRQHDIAATLGYRRPTITEACIMLQARAAIHYSRGRLHVIDREQLQAVACECYEIMETHLSQTAEALPQEIAAPTPTPRVLSIFADTARLSERIWRDHEKVRRRCLEQRQTIAEQREWLRRLNPV